MHRDALVIVHPHYGCTSKATMPHSKKMRHLRKGQEWARESPLAERILCEHNGRDSVYRREALLAKGRRETVFMLDHDLFSKWRRDELVELRRRMGPELAAQALEEVERMKNGLVSWFLENFGDGHLLGIDHRSVGLYFRRNFEFPCNMRIVLIGEYLGCCVDDVRNSLAVMSFSNVHVDEGKCAA